ncbi:MAG: flavodoxin-dependent (E)-4-hydroxy-3-methylbut-2-enyl-diphosphate synthase [Clostridia bacterium]|nr:flavodoxin-dependent (E)-4-hydroxy-3-methylbut-2-enyl-diphosphate synthase [Clostridia bacterium]
MTKRVYVKDIPIGGGSRVSVQSMCNTLTSDFDAIFKSILELAEAGCDIVRVSVPDLESVKSLKKLVLESPIPVVADVHYDYKLALESIEAGAHKLRINPGNLKKEHLRQVAMLAKDRGVPIRVGVNQGSQSVKLSPSELAKLCRDTALYMEDCGTDELVLAVKSSSVMDTISAYRELSKMTDYPLHVGLTEAGTLNMGVTKSNIAIGALLADGIGDTIRVSLTTSPIREVEEGKKILRALGLDKNFVEVVACPTCARTCIDVEKYAQEIENLTKNVKKPLKIAVMGCSVNGIGEAKGADFGVCGGKSQSIIFKDSEVLKSVDNYKVLDELIKLTESYND